MNQIIRETKEQLERNLATEVETVLSTEGEKKRIHSGNQFGKTFSVFAVIKHLVKKDEQDN